MTASGTLIADALVSLAAFLGLLLVISVVEGRGPVDPLSRRFLFGLRVVAALLASRILAWTTGLVPLQIVTTAAAGVIPLATLMFAEGLLRRHAPFVLKLLAAGGAVLFVILAPVPDRFIEPWRSTALMLFQFLGFLAIAALVIRRDRQSLSPGENRTVDRIALSLLLIVPFLVTDYRTDWLEVPVRLGGIAILALCWLAIGLGRDSLSHRDTIVAFAVIVLSALISGIALAAVDGLSWQGGMQAVAIVLSAVLLATLYNDSVGLAAERRRDSLLRHMAEGDISTSTRFLQGLQEHALVEGALILQAGDLDDFDSDVLVRAFADEPVRALGDSRLRLTGDDMREQLAWMFEKYDATHVMLASLQPLTLVALNMPALASSPGAETELRAVQRMAMLIAGRDAA